MATVYSTLLLVAQNAAADITYLNDSPNTVVLRDLDGYMGATVGISTVYLRGTDGQVIAAFFSTPAEAASFSWRGRQVIPPGESFSVTFVPAAGATYDVAVSGYSLQP